ncbi:gliding motility-associated C-terminal domain-containing protein [Carboxylicivirga sp. A043]|uniref:T9SS type B sorting domain-containing protein n=1 Tax=Carboxylicivirga litoralis TaxID=2816963 RepID=UPI0021CB4BDD|nr:gliding motility-associated C-terminal domain-containing protein [Carboxylicivirga sp. A043]MCU4155771.1 gliding motility-associated C-terminal domain-containing protein [Carboxylicivirga sp. A043]
MRRVRFLKPLLVVVAFALASIVNVDAQSIPSSEKKAMRAFFNEQFSGSARLKGVNGTIPSLDSEYCSEDGYVELVPPTIDPRTESIVWTVVAYYGGTPELHPEWADYSGTGASTVLRFYPGRVDATYHNTVRIYFGYQQYDDIGNPVGIADNDYTYVRTTPTEFTFGSDVSICTGQTATLTLNGSETGIEYFLVKDGVEGIPVSGTGNSMDFSVTAAGTYSMRAKNVLDNSCSKDMAGSAVVTVNPLPSASAGNTGDVCLGSDFTLEGDPDDLTNYTWSNPDASEAGTTQDLTLSSNDYGIGSHTFTLTVEDENTCVNTATTTVTVFENPAVIANNSGPICVGGDLTVSSTVTGGVGPYTYAWTHVPSGATYNTDAFTINNVTLAAAGEYQLIVTDANLCSAVMASTIVVVNDNPTVTVPLGPTTICEGEPLTIAATAAGGSGTYTTYTWYRDGAEIVGQTGSTLTIDPVAIGDIGAYTVIVTDNNGCVSAESLPAVIIVIPFFKPTVTNDSPVCEGGDVQLSCSSGPYVSYSWTGPNGFTSNVEDPLITEITLADAGIYSLTVEDINGCFGTETTDVIVNANPTVTAGNTGPVCDGGSVDISATPTGGTAPYSYSWQKDGNPLAYATDVFTINPVTLADAGVYSVVVTDDNTCSSTVAATTTLVVNENPTVTVAYNAPVCNGATLTLTATPANGSGIYNSYVWTKGGVVIPGETASTLTIDPVTLADGGDYGVTVVDNLGCTSTEDVVTVTINALPSPTASSNTDVCAGDQIELYGGPGGMTTYTWTGPNTFSSNLQNPTIANATTAMAGTYTLEVYDGTCSATTTTDVVVNEVQATINVSPPSFVVCENEVLTFTANDLNDNTTDTYEYEFFVNGASQGRGSSKNLVYTVTASSTIDVDVYNMTTGCSDRATTSVTMNPIPVVAITTPVLGDEFCENESITITATPGYDEYVFWSGPVGSATELYRGPNNTYTHASGFAVTTDIAVEASYSATGCSALSNIYTVVINTRPNPGINGNTTVCFDALETYTTDSGSGESNWIWTVTGGTIIGADNAASVDVQWDGIAPYSINVNYDNSDGCAAETPSSEVITVNPLPVPTINGPAVACNNSTQTYTTPDLGMTNYKWSVVGGTIVGPDNGTTVDVTWNVFGAQSVSLSYTDGNLCDAAAATVYNVTVTDLPSPTITGSDVVCTEHTYLYSTEPGANNYDWDIVGGTITTTANPYEVSVVWNTTTGAEEISVNYDVAGCPAAAPTVLPVTVSAVPVVSIVGNTDLCFGDTETYAANTLGLGKGNYTWVISGGTLTSGALDEETIDITWDGVAPYTISLNYVNTNGCDAVNSTIENITVNVVTAGLSADKTTICSIEDVTFTATGGVTYEFYVDAVSVQGPDPSDTYVASGLTDGQVVTVRAIGATGCDDTHAGIPIAVNTTPTPVITSGPDNVCNGDAGTYTAEAGYVNYVWTVTGGTITSDPTLSSIDVLWDTDGAQSVKVIYESTAGCVGAEFTLPVTVNALPTGTPFTAAPSNNVIKGTDITFTATGGVEYAFYKIDGGGVSTELQARSAIDNLVVSTEAPSANPVLDHGDIVRVYIFNAAGCNVYQEITVGIYEGITGFDVIASEAGHCFGGSIASISLSGFQPDITYELFQVGTPDVSLGKVLADAGTTTVEWTNISGTSPAAEFYVVAYYDGTPPTPPIEMNNRVFVEEYAELNIYNVSPTTEQSCGDVIDVTLDGSDAGVDYELLLNGNIEATQTSAGGPLTFVGVTLKVGTYTVRAVKDNGGIICIADMNGSFDATGDPAINTTFTIEGTKDGKYCDDGTDVVTLSLSGSQSGYDYELYFNNAPIAPTPVVVAGTDAPITFGDYTTEGVYSVIVVHSGCTYYMSGTVTVERVSLPAAFNLLAEDNGHYCANDGDGVELTLDVSEPTISYQLLLDGNPVGTPITGGTLTFGNHLAEGVYTVEASTGSPSLCVVTSNAIDVTKDVLPTKYPIVSDGDFCQGETTFLHIDNSDTDVEYFWYNNDDGTQGVAVTGTGGRLDFELAVAGSYDLRARALSGANCIVNMNDTPITIIEKPLPDNTVVVEVTDPGTDCTTGAIVTVRSSEVGVNYTLVKRVGPDYFPVVGSGYTVTGDGSDLDFDRVIDVAATYSVLAELNGCELYLNDVVVNVVGAIARQTLTSTLLEKCNGDPFNPVYGLEDSEDGVSYQLMRIDGSGTATAVGSAVAGSTGNPITFGEYGQEGTYYVTATSAACTANIEMNNRITFTIHELPTAFSLVGSGKYCDDTVGAPIELDGSEDGVTYQLQYLESGVLTDIGAPVIAGSTTGTIKFGYFTEGPGTYTVVAISPNTCTSNMKGSITVQKVAGPANQNIVGEAPYVYCADGTTGYNVSISDQEVGTIYELVKIDGTTETTIYTVTGSNEGTPLELGEVAFGTYAVYASYPTPSTVTTTCRVKMNDRDGDGVGEDFIVTSEPVAPVISPNADTGYCAGEEGVEFSVLGTQSGVGYQLVDASGTTIAFVEGTDGDDKVFPTKATAGTYHVVAKGLTSGCEISSADIVITESEAPAEFDVSIADAYVCSSEQVVINLDGSETGVEYRVVDEDSGDIKTTVNGTGSALTISFTETELGEIFYTVIASKAGLTCEKELGMVRAELTLAPTQPVVESTIDMNYCWDADGIKISLTAVEAGVDYYIVEQATGNRISFLSGDAGVLEFKESVLAGTYYVTAKSFDSGCVNNSTDFTINAYPEIQLFNMQVGAPSRGFETINEGEIGYGSINADTIRLDNSTTGVVYTLLKDGLIMTPTVELPGSGSELDYRTMSDGGLYTINASEFGCSRMMAGSVKIYEKPLIAIDDILPVPYGKSQADTSVWKNDDSDASLDINVAGDTKNIFFSLVDLSKGENYDLLPEANRITEMNTDIGNNVKIYPDGRITFTKLPTFYGRDSIDYVVFNTDYLDRRDTARVYFFAGNYDLSEDDNLLIPNAFSPNGDGFNDKFVISGRFESEVAESKLEVYNRWGSIIYRSKGKNYNEDYWDGTSNAGMVSLGQKLPSGTYFYVFKIDIIVDDTDDGIENGEKVSKEYTGFIELRR